MMLLQLMKKDLLVSRKFLLLTVVLTLIFLLYINFSAGDNSALSTLSLLYLSALSQIMFLQGMEQAEEKNSKATSYLCALPYRRKTLIQSKYMISLLIFLYCLVLQTVVSLLVSPDHLLGPVPILGALLLSTLVSGIYLPISCKYGSLKSRIVFMIAVISLALGPTIFSRLLPQVSFDASFFVRLPTLALCALLAAASATIFLISLHISIRIFEKKEL